MVVAGFEAQVAEFEIFPAAMAAGIETRLWSMEDIVRLVERREDFRSGARLVG
jgi:hypothetical protein